MILWVKRLRVGAGKSFMPFPVSPYTYGTDKKKGMPSIKRGSMGYGLCVTEKYFAASIISKALGCLGKVNKLAS